MADKKLTELTEATEVDLTDQLYAVVGETSNRITVETLRNALDTLLADNNLSELGDASVARANLGLGTAATKDDSRYAHRANNLSDLDSAPTSRDNLGLGTAATEDDSRYVNVTNTQTIAGTKTFSDGVEADSYGGDGVTQSATDTTSGRLLKVGAGSWLGNGGASVSDTLAVPQATHQFNWTNSTDNAPGPNNGTSLRLERANGDFVEFAGRAGQVSSRAWFRAGSGANSNDGYVELYHTGNTTVDGSGALFEASPIVRLYNDQITEPNQPVGATMQRVGPGHYTLTGCPPLATEGWRIRDAVGPKGDTLATVDDPVWVGDTLHVRTYVDDQPADIPEGGFVMLRFWEAKEEGDEPPNVETLTEAQEQEAALEAERARMICSRFQAKAALHGAGLLDQVPAALEEADPVAQLAWQDASEFKRNSPTILALAGEFGLGPDELDDLFRTAMQIEA